MFNVAKQVILGNTLIKWNRNLIEKNFNSLPCKAFVSYSDHPKESVLQCSMLLSKWLDGVLNCSHGIFFKVKKIL